MADIRFASALVCDEIRREDTGKYILIGVYVSEILVDRLPAGLQLSFWLIITVDTDQPRAFEMRLVGPGEAQLMRGAVTASFAKAGGPYGLPLGPAPIQLQSVGRLRLEVQLQGQEDWQEIANLTVSLRQPQT